MSTTQKFIEWVGPLAEIDGIDKAAINRFINGTVNRQSVDPKDAMQAAVLLAGLGQGILGGDNMNTELRTLFGTRKISKGKYGFRPDEATIDSTAFAIVLRLLRDENFTNEDAVDEFTWYIAPEASTKQINRWIEAITPRAEMMLRLEQDFKPCPNSDKNR